MHPVGQDLPNMANAQNRIESPVGEIISQSFNPLVASSAPLLLKVANTVKSVAHYVVGGAFFCSFGVIETPTPQMAAIHIGTCCVLGAGSAVIRSAASKTVEYLSTFQTPAQNVALAVTSFNNVQKENRKIREENREVRAENASLFQKNRQLRESLPETYNKTLLVTNNLTTTSRNIGNAGQSFENAVADAKPMTQTMQEMNNRIKHLEGLLEDKFKLEIELKQKTDDLEKAKLLVEDYKNALISMKKEKEALVKEIKILTKEKEGLIKEKESLQK